MKLFVAGLSLLTLFTALSGAARAADLSHALPTKAPPPAPAYDWTGYYIGGYLGYATGSARWSSAPAPGTGLGGSIDLFNSYSAFKGTGSYLLGLEGGYDRMLASRWVLGWQGDMSFPSFGRTIGGSSTFGSVPTGVASFGDQTEFFGTVRGRVGYSPNVAGGHWLFYATGGFAWSVDLFTRTQVAGTAPGVTAGTVEHVTASRFGGVAGGGVELALTPSWMARLEYLFTDYGNRSVTFPLSGQPFNSDFVTHSVRVGFDYKIGTDSVSPDFFLNGPQALQMDRFAIHGQMNFVEQYVPPFHAPYHGQNSLDANQGREAWGSMFFAGVRLWDGAEFWINPEIDQGFGPSNSVGAAGYPGGAAYKVGSASPYARIQRSFLRQTIDLGGDAVKIDGDQNVFAATTTTNRLVITVGKYAPTDMFDQNKYASNPRKDFMNWGLINTGTFDFAGDAWGFTYGATAEWYQGDWTVRAGLFDLPLVPNSTDLDASFGQFQWVGEVERRWELWSHPGKIAVTGFLTRARLGTFQDAIALAQTLGTAADTTPVRQFRSRTGISMNVEQEITQDLGAFMRAGIADPKVEPDVYTDIDRTVAAGFQLKGRQWGRPNDTFGLAGVVNSIGAAHQAYLNAGGIGIEVGDGMLPHPGLEQIIETYYAFPIYNWQATFDYQLVANPAYNRDRGPASLVAFRLYSQF
jgi:high affinity Mn2+ porin